MADLNLQEIHDFLIEVAKKAGEMITSAKPSTTTTGEKKNSADLVTETDQAVEKMVSTTLKEKYPSFSFMGEETYKPGDKLTPNPTFIVDPIDGTTNFVHGYPYVSISLGLAVDLTPTVGVVYNPFTQTLYSAIRGGGAFLNRTTPLPLREPEPMQDLSTTVCCVEWGSDRTGNDYKVKSETFAKLCARKEEGGAMVHGLRSFGSAALNLCGVASGALDIYWEAGCWPWDVCAGWVVLTEAGGIVVDGNPGEWKPRIDQRRYLAVRKGEGQKAIVEEFWGFVQGKFEVGN
ncbi:Inositol monophosphatase [Lasiodiplodia theobromae]|uniref:Inositol-1-monophosphatase n=2 Tax=Lasiodiplodia TaxID=66739 RepID=A0A5N5DDJ7_9PEZI|nr:Inositol monophosphatase [Lasiodiplodia theobromae]KAB2575936.1 Inositol monophosphatase 2 [Lasiodiplodia theobromae]KAF4545023.1 Inositol monophosphatase [Lasiodiplodia theobromae]KAF9631680.1 Inositol monophosphatase [Lasiodiplodia theobromae]KAK0662757.1 Inositol monophosphatase 2 [Lasiodiplodia hormozganensis]